MFRQTIAAYAIVGLFVWAVPTFAAPDAVSKRGVVSLSVHEKVTDNLYSLGRKYDRATGEYVEGYAIVRYKKGHGRSVNAARRGGTSSCYAYLSRGAKWRWVEPWVVNPVNSRGLDHAFVYDNLVSDIAKWEDATDGIVGNAAGVDVLGGGLVTSSTIVADTASPDGVNEVYFSDIDDPGAIAVTIVWGVFGGPTSGRRLVEWDQVYDDSDYDWSSSGEAGKMDFENIATHELGHSVGLADLYTTACAEQTMYGYAATGEVAKRDLNVGDIAGMNGLY